MNKFLIVEARRLLPLAFLLALLVSLSVYDNFFRLQPVDTPPGTVDEDFLFVTATRGEIDAPTSFKLAYSQEQWEELQEHPQLDLPDYPFNESYEVALCTVNSQVEDIEVEPAPDEVTGVTVKVSDSPQNFHLVMINRDRLKTPEVHWSFQDEEGEVIHEKKIEDQGGEEK